MTVPAGRFPTQSAWPDCFGLRGGPLGVDGTLPELEPELTLLTAMAAVSLDYERRGKIACLADCRASSMPLEIHTKNMV